MKINRGGGTDVLPDFLKLNSKVDVLQCIQRGMEFLETQERPEICIKLHTVSEALMMQLKSFCNKRTESEIEVAFCTTDKNAEHKIESLELTRIMIDLMMQKSSVKCYYGNVMDEIGETEQNWIVSESFFVQFSDDMSYGMFTREKEWIQFFLDSFQQVKEKCSQICIGKCEALTDVFKNSGNGKKVRVIEYMPCFSVALTEKILQKVIHKKIPFREELICGILENFRCLALRMDEIVNVFETQGILEFMETGKVDIFPYGIYEPIALADRCEMLQYIIEVAEKAPSWQFLMLKEGIADLKGVHMEQRMDENGVGTVFLEIHFDERENEQIEIMDESIKNECWKFFDYLREYGYVYSKDETLERMRGILGKYQELYQKKY